MARSNSAMIAGEGADASSPNALEALTSEAAEVTTAPLSAEPSATKTAEPETGAARPARRPFGETAQKLAYPPRPGFRRYWFNDTPGRVARAQEAGYEHVTESGKPVVRVVGVYEGGAAAHAYLMEIPEEWYQQDMAKQQQSIDEVDRAIKRGSLHGKPGQDGQAGADGSYVKKISITSETGRSTPAPDTPRFST